MAEWRESKDALREARDALEAASLCLEVTFRDPGPGSRGWLAAASRAVVSGKGAPSPRVIGAGGAWAWLTPSNVWLLEQAARHRARAARAHKRAARGHRLARRRRIRPDREGTGR